MQRVGRLTFNANGSVDLNDPTHTAVLTVEGRNDSGSNDNEVNITGDNVVITQDGADTSNAPGRGFSAQITDVHQGSSHQVLSFDANTTVTRASNSSLGFENSPTVSGSVAATNITGFNAEAPIYSGGGSAAHVYYYATGLLGAVGTGATTEEFGNYVRTVPN